jgi:hypothetical protein
LACQIIPTWSIAPSIQKIKKIVEAVFALDKSVENEQQLDPSIYLCLMTHVKSEFLQCAICVESVCGNCMNEYSIVRKVSGRSRSPEVKYTKPADANNKIVIRAYAVTLQILTILPAGFYSFSYYCIRFPQIAEFFAHSFATFTITFTTDARNGAFLSRIQHPSPLAKSRHGHQSRHDAILSTP